MPTEWREDMAAKKKDAPVKYEAGDKVKYEGAEYEVVQTFGTDGKYAVLFGQGKRFSVETKKLEKM